MRKEVNANLIANAQNVQYSLICDGSINKCGGNFKIRISPFIWNAFSLTISDCVSWMHSRPYRILLLKMESKTRIFQRTDVWALSQKSFSLWHVVEAAANLLQISLWLSTLSERSVPKYVGLVCLLLKEVKEFHVSSGWWQCFIPRLRPLRLRLLSSWLHGWHPKTQGTRSGLGHALSQY